METDTRNRKVQLRLHSKTWNHFASSCVCGLLRCNTSNQSPTRADSTHTFLEHLSACFMDVTSATVLRYKGTMFFHPLRCPSTPQTNTASSTAFFVCNHQTKLCKENTSLTDLNVQPQRSLATCVAHSARTRCINNHAPPSLNAGLFVAHTKDGRTMLELESRHAHRHLHLDVCTIGLPLHRVQFSTPLGDHIGASGAFQDRADVAR